MLVKAALIVMTILGCDDSVTQCHYIDTVAESWQTIALCDAQSEALIGRYQNSNYPVVVAVCENDGKLENVDALADFPAPPPDALAATPAQPLEVPTTTPPQPGISARTMAMLKSRLPDGVALKQTLSKPFRYAEDGYSWVVKKFAD